MRTSAAGGSSEDADSAACSRRSPSSTRVSLSVLETSRACFTRGHSTAWNCKSGHASSAVAPLALCSGLLTLAKVT